MIFTSLEEAKEFALNELNKLRKKRIENRAKADSALSDAMSALHAQVAHPERARRIKRNRTKHQEK